MDTTYMMSDTDKIAQDIIKELPVGDTATIIGLSGDLGAGKTTLVQALARALGVREQVVSPTFVIAKFYETANIYEKLIHIDAYRIDDPQELIALVWEAMINEPRTLIVVEWPERIETLLPKTIIRYHISHEGELRRIYSL